MTSSGRWARAGVRVLGPPCGSPQAERLNHRLRSPPGLQPQVQVHGGSLWAERARLPLAGPPAPAASAAVGAVLSLGSTLSSLPVGKDTSHWIMG